MKTLNYLVLAAATLISTLTWAQESSSPAEPPKPSVQVAGKVWTQFTYDATEAATHKSGFDVYRAFLQATYKYDDMWTGVLLLDGQRGETATGTTGAITKANIWGYVRNAYVQASGLWEGGGTFRFGLQPTPYISVIDGVDKTRWLGTNLVDRTTLMRSQSGGASISGMSGSAIKYIAMIHNGDEGLTKTGATDDGLALSTLVSFYPFANDGDSPLKKLGLTVSDDYQSAGFSTTSTLSAGGFNLIMAAVHYEASCMDLVFETAIQKERNLESASRGHGLTANFRFGPEQKASIYARYYGGEPQFQSAKLRAKSILAVGPTYSFIKDKVLSAIVYETQESLSGAPAQRLLSWNWAVNF